MTKTILITGCSSGIGQNAAIALKQRGYRVFASARKEQDLQKLSALGLETITMDMNDSASIVNGFNRVMEQTNNTLDALFNNAGYAQTGAIEDLSRDMMRKQFETNVFGVMELTNLAIPIMRKQGHGRIIQNTSILGIVGLAYRGAYCASKFALEGFTNTLRQELHGTTIFVSIIAPGPILSKFRENAFKSYQETIAKEKSIHESLYHSMEKYFFAPEDNARAFTLGPEAVTKKLIAALESKKPKAHYYIGFPAHLFAFLRRVLPDRLLDWVMLKVVSGEKNN